jgi:hypothetical protein
MDGCCTLCSIQELAIREHAARGISIYTPGGKSFKLRYNKIENISDPFSPIPPLAAAALFLISYVLKTTIPMCPYTLWLKSGPHMSDLKSRAGNEGTKRKRVKFSTTAADTSSLQKSLLVENPIF